MTKEEAEDYIKKLESFEKSINTDSDDEELDMNFLGELNDLLDKLNSEMVNPKDTKKEYTNEDFDLQFNVNVKVKKLHENAVVPSYSKDGDAGMDLRWWFHERHRHPRRVRRRHHGGGEQRDHRVYAIPSGRVRFSLPQPAFHQQRGSAR